MLGAPSFHRAFSLSVCLVGIGVSNVFYTGSSSCISHFS